MDKVLSSEVTHIAVICQEKSSTEITLPHVLCCEPQWPTKPEDTKRQASQPLPSTSPLPPPLQSTPKHSAFRAQRCPYWGVDQLITTAWPASYSWTLGYHTLGVSGNISGKQRRIAVFHPRILHSRIALGRASKVFSVTSKSACLLRARHHTENAIDVLAISGESPSTSNTPCCNSICKEVPRPDGVPSHVGLNLNLRERSVEPPPPLKPVGKIPLRPRPPRPAVFLATS